MSKPSVFAVLLLFVGGPAVAARATAPAIHTEDVAAFYRLYDATGGHPTATQLQHDYLDTGSDGLHTLAKLRNVTGERIAATLASRPEIYTGARRCLAVLPRVRERATAALAQLARLTPDARLPPVTIAIGRGKPVGVGSPLSGIQIGLEALCATDWMNPDIEQRFVSVIAHEYAHTQQAPALTEKEHPTVLEASLIEGAAEFVADRIADRPAYAYFDRLTRGREREIDTAFVADLDKTDLSAWLYNSTPEKPADLGYWVGYRIVKAYYDRASDKRAALRAILAMDDAKAFLVASGWRPR